jgi:hypothetical protein
MVPCVFNNMATDQKKAMIELSGTCLDLRYEPKFIVYLYKVFDVFIEAYYHRRDGFVKAEAVTASRLSLYEQSTTHPLSFGEMVLNFLRFSNWEMIWIKAACPGMIFNLIFILNPKTYFDAVVQPG